MMSSDDESSDSSGIVRILPETADWSMLLNQLTDHPERLTSIWQEKNRENQTFLHQLLYREVPKEVLQRVIEIAPDSLEVRDIALKTPLFIAAWKASSPDTVRVLFEAYPEAVFIPNEYYDYPLHILIESLTSQWIFDRDILNEEWVQIIRLLLDSFPECSVTSNRFGNNPFQQLLDVWEYASPSAQNLGEATYWVLRERFEAQNIGIDDAVFLPLHALAGEEDTALDIKPLRNYFFKRHSENASCLDHNYRLPLHIAIEDGYRWIEYGISLNPLSGRADVLCKDSCIHDLFQLSSKAGKTRDITTRLYPFMAAAIKGRGVADIDTVFQLLKQHPYAARGLCSNQR